MVAAGNLLITAVQGDGLQTGAGGGGSGRLHRALHPLMVQ